MKHSGEGERRPACCRSCGLDALRTLTSTRRSARMDRAGTRARRVLPLEGDPPVVLKQRGEIPHRIDSRTTSGTTPRSRRWNRICTRPCIPPSLEKCEGCCGIDARLRARSRVNLSSSCARRHRAPVRVLSSNDFRERGVASAYCEIARRCSRAHVRRDRPVDPCAFIATGWTKEGDLRGVAAGNTVSSQPPPEFLGGAEGDRTLDLRIANATLSQLSYRPTL